MTFILCIYRCFLELNANLTKMRAHLPVVTTDYVLNDGDIIVTKPDLKGKRTYVNRDFLKISRCAVLESIGAPHSLMRHSDMPQDTFEDVWRSPKSGKSWNGGRKFAVKMVTATAARRR
ncbi:hypothetical protein [Noviherbaspirillum autotrophicum]|uniref:hypothetical protein n=1 Tax=Noviherbaspirillum autotrophicum TaxID=709839 RepID=UPI00069372C6|nr:hypothetical protein [Noviherbaspirillum autotrophicum]